MMPTVPTSNAETVFKPSNKRDLIKFSSKAELARLDVPLDAVQRLGPGDILSVSVWGRPELTGRHVIGPDGRITIPLGGSVKLLGATREQASNLIRTLLLRYYEAPAVTVAVEQYTSNRITVLGRVQNPGIIQFDQAPTILEVLARAGALPVIDKEASLSRCAVIRGRQQLFWIDLNRLLNHGDIALNLRLMPGDLVYIPETADTMVYVLGEVGKPGAYRITPNMSLLDALAQAGGPNESAATDEIGIYRPSTKAVQRVPLKDLLLATRNVNYVLEEGDIIYVPKSGIADFGFVVNQLSPGLTAISLGTLLLKK
jgi:polysaccharide export outer membrane protein